MRVTTIVSLGASAVLGIGALFAAKFWLPDSEKDKVVQTAPVVVAASPIEFGTRLDEKNLAVVQLPVEAAPAVYPAESVAEPATADPAWGVEALVPVGIAGRRSLQDGAQGAIPSRRTIVSAAMPTASVKVGKAGWSSAICSTRMLAAMQAAAIWITSAEYSPRTCAPST